MTLRAGSTGEVVGHSSSNTLGLTCSGDSKLVAVDANGARFEDVPGPGSPPELCVSGGGYTLRPLPDGKLAYAATGAGSGNPSGTLTKKGGKGG
ncbi:MAG: hypothetical protein HOV68_05130 [Streptomycetaceae bacterium]|nr:hypothetical protein [Streptomycetaceae bacterium]